MNLHEFATSTLHALARMEDLQLSFPTGLRVFCRMDIGVIRGPDKKFHYWVNEIDRTPNASLFSCGAGTWGETTAMDFAKTFRDYVCPR